MVSYLALFYCSFSTSTTTHMLELFTFQFSVFSFQFSVLTALRVLETATARHSKSKHFIYPRLFAALTALRAIEPASARFVCK